MGGKHGGRKELNWNRGWAVESPMTSDGKQKQSWTTGVGRKKQTSEERRGEGGEMEPPTEKKTARRKTPKRSGGEKK